MKERKSQHVPPAHKTRVAGVESETQTRASSRRNDFYTVSGGYSGEVTPDPISNSEVKLASANGTARETLWESRTPPDFSWKPPTAMSGVSSFCVLKTLDTRRGFLLGTERPRWTQPTTILHDAADANDNDLTPRHRQCSTPSQGPPTATSGKMHPVDVQQRLLLIADIGGYTRYMLATRISLAHAQVAVTGLLEAVLDGATHLQLAKLEGDAAFFHAPAATAPGLANEVAEIRRRFLEKKQQLVADRLCNCAGCTQLEGLTLKFMAHTGEVAIHKVRQLEELSGIDVILVHRLLKNTVPIKEYPLCQHG